ncbi:hypothetical protein AVEN_233238-1 [Araneus ventricosus]|uniref:Uncharacterized protein n=1 Tax=Araneus ventricosus TaxID=182803 RepID=A0A4Y2EM31_ARAVE|nr:hypothetical protein AVEN_233238-1 [Araneus ventricosus]
MEKTCLGSPEGTEEALCHVCPPGVPCWWGFVGTVLNFKPFAFCRTVKSLCIPNCSNEGTLREDTDTRYTIQPRESMSVSHHFDISTKFLVLTDDTFLHSPSNSNQTSRPRIFSPSPLFYQQAFT